jgi:hypothetical protein
MPAPPAEYAYYDIKPPERQLSAGKYPADGSWNRAGFQTRRKALSAAGFRAGKGLKPEVEFAGVPGYNKWMSGV